MHRSFHFPWFHARIEQPHRAMIKVTDVVKDLLYSSEPTLACLSRGHLNLSAYAKSIQPEVEKRTRKAVTLGSIVVALSRISSELKKAEPLVPHVVLENISIKSGLSEIAFDRTGAVRDKLQVLYRDPKFASADFLAVTHGMAEISIVVPDELRRTVLSAFRNHKPKLVIENLASLTVRYDERYLHIPNTFYSLLRHLAVKRINIYEIISTYTEITFLLHQEDLKEAFLTINALFGRPAQQE